jgi:hypothetical protein
MYWCRRCLVASADKKKIAWHLVFMRTFNQCHYLSMFCASFHLLTRVLTRRCQPFALNKHIRRVTFWNICSNCT